MQDRNNLISVTEEQFIGSIAVIQKNDFVVTGTLTHIEGDLIELEIGGADADMLKLGIEVKLVVYTQHGILNFTTSLVAKEFGTVLFLVPPDIQSLFLKKRSHPRFEINMRGKLFAEPDELGGAEPYSKDPLEILVNNVGLGGIGFTTDASILIPEKKIMYVDMFFENKMLLALEIIHNKPMEESLYYGAKFVELSSKSFTSLRAFILMKQVQLRIDLKKQSKLAP